MQTINAIKKLENLGFERIKGELSFSYSKTSMKDCIEFTSQNGEVICLGVRSKKENSDIRSDYCATFFCKSLSQAIRFAS